MKPHDKNNAGIAVVLKRHLALVRPHQWVKNLLLFFPPFFGAKLGHPESLAVLLPAFFSFSFAASCGYIINDIKDRETDRHHISKKERPLAGGQISITAAGLIAFFLYGAAIIIGGSISARFEAHLIVYLFISLLYTFYFKHVVIADIFFVSFGFLIRVLAGGEAFKVIVSNWLFLTVFIVALFLTTGKRLGELVSMGENARKHRAIINSYSSSFLEGLLWFSASASLVSYALYVIEYNTRIFFTVPVAAFGLLRYIYIVKEGRGDPTDAFFKDRQIMITGIIWVLTIAGILY